MKLSEMNANQRKAWEIAVEAVNMYIGGYENQMEDSEEGSENWIEAYNALHASHEEMVETCLAWARMSREWERLEHLHFVGIDFLRERVHKRLVKYGY